MSFGRAPSPSLNHPVTMSLLMQQETAMAITQVNPYIHFNGDAAQAIKHYEAVLGAKVERSMTYGQMPGNTPKSENKDRVLHCALKLGACTLMLSDAPAEQAGIVGTNVEVSLAYDNEDELRKAFDGLSQDGQVVLPLHEAFWGGTFGMLVDRFGVAWAVNGEPLPFG
jgi:PhnB protein